MGAMQREKTVYLPMTKADFETVSRWRDAQGLTNKGVGRRLVELAREELAEEGDR